MAHPNENRICDSLCREILLLRDVKCQRCGCTIREKLVVSHVYAKKPYPNIRHEPENMLLLCGTCHEWWHANLAKGWEWFNDNWADRAERLLILKNQRFKLNKEHYAIKKEELRAELKERQRISNALLSTGSLMADFWVTK